MPAASVAAEPTRTGPLAGVTVLELAGIGPGPFAGMLLADMGARVIRIDRAGPAGHGAVTDLMRNDSQVDRGRESVAVNLKDLRGIEVVLRLVERADLLIEGYRPGVTDKLGLGPATCLARNPRLVYGRMTGWGQTGPLAPAAGHDLNYIALSGALHAIGPADGPPVPPLNLVGDYGGGGMLLVVGLLAALHAARANGVGQVVDAAMCDGVAQLMAPIYALQAKGAWSGGRASNLLDGGAPFYACYICADGRSITVGAIEPQFFRELLQRCGVDDPLFDDPWDRQRWPAQRAALARLFATRSRDAWCALLEGTDACFAPVLSMAEAPQHPHHRARRTFVERDGQWQPAPAPRFSGTPSTLAPPAPTAGQHSRTVLADLGFDETQVAALVADLVVTPGP